MLKHVSAFVAPGARAPKCLTYSGYDNQLAFLNPDGSIVIVIQNDMSVEMPVRIMLGDRVIAPTLPADSFSTIVLQPARLERPQRRGSQTTTGIFRVVFC